MQTTYDFLRQHGVYVTSYSPVMKTRRTVSKHRASHKGYSHVKKLSIGEKRHLEFLTGKKAK